MVRTDAKRNRERITEVARELIAEQGGDVSMEAIAGGASVAVGTLYRHYATKADLVEAVIEKAAAEIATIVLSAEAAVAAGGDVREELGSMLRAIAARGAENRALRAAARSLGVADPLRPDEVPPPSGSPMATAQTAADRLLEVARDARVVRADTTRTDIAVLLRGVLDVELDDRSRERYVEIILAGLRPARR